MQAKYRVAKVITVVGITTWLSFATPLTARLNAQNAMDAPGSSPGKSFSNTDQLTKDALCNPDAVSGVDCFSPTMLLSTTASHWKAR